MGAPLSRGHSTAQLIAPYYADKLGLLSDIFGQSVELHGDVLRVGTNDYSIVDDVIVLLSADQRPHSAEGAEQSDATFSKAVQTGFGREWIEYADILPEHAQEFESYFDLIDLNELSTKRVCDFGCGSGRWSHFMSRHCQELILVDFSEAIFVARRNLRNVNNAVFFMGDVTRLPFREDCADLGFCLGVLHHLPTPALSAVVTLGRYAKTLVVYLYYALDNRPLHFRLLFLAVNRTRIQLSRVNNAWLRRILAKGIAVCVYGPLILLGRLLALIGKGNLVPLFEYYRGMSHRRIEQDAYDRFFTRIEQRVSRESIRQELTPAFRLVAISDRLPYWHFLCKR